MVLIDGVEFELIWFPQLGSQINWELSRDGRRIIGVSSGLQFKATINATGRESDIREFQAGIIQTVYHSKREFYYLSSKRTKTVEYITPVPAWDGDRDSGPWFQAPEDFEVEQARGTIEIPFSDAPICPAGELGQGLGTLVDPTAPEEGPTLLEIDGEDSFKVWVAVIKGNAITFLNEGYSWYINWHACVTVRGRTVALVTEGGTFAGKGKGNDGRPMLTGEAANELSRVVYTTW